MGEFRKLRTIRGTKDILSNEFYKFRYVQNTAQDISRLYGYNPVDTPIIEYEEIFTKTLGDSSDIVTKEIYSFQDKGGDNIALRPEFTAPTVRMLLNNKLTVPVKLFSTGPIFRYERPQKCRYRQFHQVNFESFGAADPFDCVEVLSLAHQIASELKILDKVTLEINSLGDEESISLYKKELVNYLSKHKEDLSENSKKRLEVNPMRILDSKDSSDREILLKAPDIDDFYNDNSRLFFADVLKGLNKLNIAYKINKKLVRGLDYYSHVVFEFTTSILGSQGAVFAGGRYDRLVSLMGGDEIISMGFAGGIERIASLLNYQVLKVRPVCLLTVEQDLKEYCLSLACTLRGRGFAINCFYDNLSMKSLLKKANRSVSKFVIIVSNSHLKNNMVIIRNMDTGFQSEVSVDLIESSLRSHL